MNSEVNKCLGCPMPQCEKGCPLHNHIRDFIKAYKEGDPNKARAIIALENPFPYLTSRICAFKDQCEGNCIKNKINDPIKVQKIERELSAIDLKLVKKPANFKKVAVIGAGASGMAISKLLALEGFSVTLFDKEDFSGGTLQTGIPAFRLERKYILKAIVELEELGVNFSLGQNLNAANVISLKKEYDRIVIATGTMATNKMNIKGEENSLDGLRLLYDLNILHKEAEYKKYQKALVVGGGNVALDCALSLKRIIKDVSIIYRRSIKEMPANKEEVAEAIAQGIELIELNNPVKVDKDGVMAIKMVLGEKDASGRASFHPVANSEHFIKADLVVMAIGQKVKTEDLEGFTLDNKGRLAVSDNYETSINGIYACGDVVNGPSNVANAFQSAKECFKGIMESYTCLRSRNT